MQNNSHKACVHNKSQRKGRKKGMGKGKGRGEEEDAKASLERAIHSLNKASRASNAGTVGGGTVGTLREQLRLQLEGVGGVAMADGSGVLPICQHKIRQQS